MTQSLTSKFEALHAERERSWDPAKLRGNIDQRAKLVEAFDPGAVVHAGDDVAPFTLDLSTGGTVDSAALTADGPVALIFFRFAGCPACNLALPHYDQTLVPALRAAGIRPVAVSPHLPERGLDDIRARHDLSYDVASDRGNVLARRFGFAFEPGTPIPQGDDNWIGALTGIGTWELTYPAVVVIGADHIVRFADSSPDWLRRTESETVIAALDLEDSKPRLVEPV